VLNVWAGLDTFVRIHHIQSTQVEIHLTLSDYQSRFFLRLTVVVTQCHFVFNKPLVFSNHSRAWYEAYEAYSDTCC